MTLSADGDREAVAAAVASIAKAGADGALLLLEAERTTVAALRDRGTSNQEVDVLLCNAAAAAQKRWPAAAWARASWTGFWLVLDGPKDELVTATIALMEGLAASPVRWQAIVTRIFPGEPARTHHCDPGYDLRNEHGSFVAWVDPYAGDDWRASQRYPRTAIVWRAS